MSSFTPYQRRLFLLLSVAIFFEGYDFIALSQLLDTLRDEFGLTKDQGGWLVGLIGIGTILSWWVVRLADRWGRRRVLMITILGYALFTGLTALSRNVWEFGFFQLVGRVFLIAEWALTMVYAAEEFPAERRGMAIGILQAVNVVGAVACAALIPVMKSTPLGWRTVYVAGIIPLLLLAYARRGLKETDRFAAVSQRAGPRRGLAEILRSPYRLRVLQLALIWGLTYICTQCVVFFWKDFAMTEAGMSDSDSARAIVLAAIISLPFVFLVGKLLDKWGRKRSAVLIYSLLALSAVGAYQLTGYWPMAAALMVAVFANGAVLSLLNSYTSELFATEWRGDAFAWANSLLGRMGYVVGPIVIGQLAVTAGWRNSVPLTAVFVVAALVLIMVWLPETKGQELEETARV